MTDKAVRQNRFDNDQIHIAYDELNDSLNSLKVGFGFLGAFTVPAIGAVIHPSGTLDAVTLIGATAFTALGVHSSVKIRNRVSDIVTPLKEQGEDIKKTVSAQLNKVSFRQVIASVAAWQTMAAIGAGIFGGIPANIAWSIAAAGVTLTAAAGYAFWRGERNLRTTLSQLPAPK